MRKTNFQLRFERGPRALSRNLHMLCASERLRFHIIPQMLLAFVEQTIPIGANQELRVLRIAQSFMKKFIDISFAVTHAYQHRLGTMLLRRDHRAITHQPIVTFFFCDRRFFRATFFTARFGKRTRPALHVHETQRRAFQIERHRVVQHKTNRPNPPARA